MSHDKTRIMPRAAAAPAAGRTPGKRVGDKIVFHCSNGHKLVVLAQHAGKRGKCDRPGCGVQVVIPVVEATVEMPLATPVVEPPVIGIPEPPVEPVPALPEPDEAGGGDRAAETDTSSPWSFIASSETAPPVAVDVATDLLADANDVRQSPAPALPRPAEEHPTSWLIKRLWAEREHGGKVELHLVGGGVILPEWYESKWSRGSHGLFASLAADGSMTLTAVAWDTIQKVVVRQVQGLPDGMFDDQ